jgi:hypothetical protein
MMGYDFFAFCLDANPCVPTNREIKARINTFTSECSEPGVQLLHVSNGMFQYDGWHCSGCKPGNHCSYVTNY